MGEKRKIPLDRHGPNMWLFTGLVAAGAAVAGLAIVYDQSPPPKRTASFMMYKLLNGNPYLEGCFYDGSSERVGTLQLTPDEKLDPNRSSLHYTFLSYSGAPQQAHLIPSLKSLRPYEFSGYDGVHETSEDKSKGNTIRCIEPIPAGSIPGALNGMFFEVTHHDGQDQIPYLAIGPYTDTTTATGGNITNVPGYGKTQAITYPIDQAIATGS